MERNGSGVGTELARGEALISGASFAGLATAWWLRELGYRVTVVEVAAGLRKGGTPVDIRKGVVEVVRRMGLLEQIAAASLPARPTVMLGVDGQPLERADGESGEMEFARDSEQDAAQEWEIERDALLDMLFDRVKDDVEFRFNDSIETVSETADAVCVRFAATGEQRKFELLLGCDGTHSAVRRMCFGEEREFVLFLENYFSLTIVDRLLLPEDTAQIYSVPGRTVMLNAYHGKTDIAFSFFAEHEVAYDRRDREQQRQMIRDHFAGGGWRTQELLNEMDRCDDFYFDKLCQVRMPVWSKGRVVLVGDAGYCPSPAAGMGGSMALLGASALADALRMHPTDLQAAFREYDRRLRPTVEEIQRGAVEVGMRMFLPRTDEELRARNERMGLR